MPSTPLYATIKPQAKVSQGTTAAALVSTSSREVWITADDANSGKLFLGDSTVTSAGGGNVFTKLQAGQTCVIQITNPSLLYAVGSASAQVFYVGVLD